MKSVSMLALGGAFSALILSAAPAAAQDERPVPGLGPTTRPLGPGGPPGGPGRGMGGPMGQDRKLVAQFDRDADGRLNDDERKAAREQVKKDAATGQGRRGLGGGGGGRGGPGGIDGRGPASRPAGGDDVVVAPGGPGGPDFRGGPAGGFGPGGFGPGGPGGRGGNREPAKPGPCVAPADVRPPPAGASLYEPSVLRTLFLDFPSGDWETELQDFRNSDVEVPATLTVDGKAYPGVGVHFRGKSSMNVPAGYKHSLNVSVDFTDDKQRVLGVRTLNLLNAHEDPTFLRSILFSHVARQYIPAPRANLVKVVINGESWGVYVNAEQFNSDFVKAHFPEEKKPKKGSGGTAAEKAAGEKKNGGQPPADKKVAAAKPARWKVTGSPGGDGGLTFVGDDVAQYKRRYEIKSSDDPAAWKALVDLCRTLNETPPDQLQAALEPVLDIDGALWFLALDNALSNADGYWTRASDYSLYKDAAGRFHVIPHDMNETFSAGGGPMMGGGPGMGRGGPGGRGPDGGFPPGGGPAAGDDRPPPDGGPRGGPDGGFGGGRGRPGGGGGPGGGGPGGGGGVRLDPLVGLDDARKPLRSKLLAVPALRAKYLADVRTIAEQWLDWDKLGPVVQQYRALAEKEIEADTRKLDSIAAFRAGVGDAADPAAPADGRRRASLKEFAAERRKFLLEHPAVKDAGK